MYPGQLYEKAKESITNMTRADYLFLISYSNYSGYRIEHDPMYTVYFAPTAATGTNYGGLIVLAIIGAVVIATVAIVISRRKEQKQPPQPSTAKETTSPPLI